MPPEALHDLLARTHQAFQAAGLEAMFRGKTAAHLWGWRDPGLEIEVLTKLQPGDVDHLLAAAEAAGFAVDTGLAGLAAEQGEHLTLFPGEDVFVDVKPARGAGDLAALRTRVEREVAGTFVASASLEETIAELLDDGSEEALDAARTVLAQHEHAIDEMALGQRCEDLRVGPLLAELRAEASPAPAP